MSETGLRKELSDWGKLGKPVMFTEYGADTVSGLHDTTSVMYTEEYQVEYYEMNNKGTVHKRQKTKDGCSLLP